MAVRDPIEYDIQPRHIDAGQRWLMLRLKNVGDEDLKSLSVQLSSLDDYALHVQGTGSYMDVLRAGEEQGVPFQVMAHRSGMVYAVVEGWKNGEPFT